ETLWFQARRQSQTYDASGRRTCVHVEKIARQFAELLVDTVQNDCRKKASGSSTVNREDPVGCGVGFLCHGVRVRLTIRLMYNCGAISSALPFVAHRQCQKVWDWR